MRAAAFFLSLMLLTTGCVPVLIAVGAGAVGGYAVSRDTFEGVTNKGQDELFSAAQTVVSIMGTIEEADKKRGEIHGRVYGTSVTVTVVPVNLTTSKLRIKARKGIFPRIGVAQEVYTKITNQLEQ